MAQTDTTTLPTFETTYEVESVVLRDSFGYAEVRYGRLSRTVRASVASISAAIAELQTLVAMEGAK